MDVLVVEPGAVWTGVDQDGTVEEIDPNTDTVVASQNIGSELRNPTLGGGSLWVPGFGSSHVFRIEPT